MIAISTKPQSLVEAGASGISTVLGFANKIAKSTKKGLMEVFSTSSRKKIVNTKSAALVGALALGAATGGAGLAAGAGLLAGFKYIRGKSDYTAIVTDPLNGAVGIGHGLAKIATAPVSTAGDIANNRTLPASRHSNFASPQSANADAGDDSTPDTNTTPAQTPASPSNATPQAASPTQPAATPQSNTSPSPANNTPPQNQPNPSNQANNTPTPANTTAASNSTTTPSGSTNTASAPISNSSNASTLTREQRRAQQAFENDKKEDLRGLSEDFETDIGDISKKLNDLVDKIKTIPSGGVADRYHIIDSTKQESITKLLKKGSSRRDPQAIESLIQKDLFKKTTTTGYFSTDTNYGPVQTSAISTIASTGNRIVTEITRKLRPLTDADFTAGAGASNIKKDIIDDIKDIMSDLIKLIKDSNEKIKEKSEEQFDLSTV